MQPIDRVLICVYSTGLVYADRARQVDRDYKRLAFLAFDTLELTVEDDCPSGLRSFVVTDALRLQGRCGDQYEISASGQTIRLGSARPMKQWRVSVQRDAQPYAMVVVDARDAIQAADAGERKAAQMYDGNLDELPCWFADKIVPIP